MTELTTRLSAALADRYRIERRLGEGGMASVYVAEDLKHKRHVALKVLKPDLAAVLGAERFVQEITTTASLQHPHILPLFDSGSADGFLFYVMPYIEGETLRERLDREHQLGIDEAVRMTSEVADALDYAHRHGVIHRDIKPENILLHDGRPMVADFGIALAVSAAAGGRMTETGLSLGTPHYMSPEQATAEKEITARSDIYSLGSVLYEMLTGEPPHLGTSAQQIIMKIVTEDVAPVTKLRKSVPPHVAAAVTKSLEKLPADRFESAKAFATALGNPAFTVATTASPARMVRSTRSPLTMVLAATTVVAIGVAGWALTREPVSPPPVWHEMVMPPRVAPVANMPMHTMSPDGQSIVYLGVASSGRTQFFVRDRSSLDGRPIAGTEDAMGPAVSPDGTRIAFVSRAGLRTVSMTGGPVTTLADSIGAWSGLAWGDDGYVYLGGVRGLRRVPETGGRPELVAGGADTLWAAWPDVLPGGRAALVTDQRGSPQIVVLDLQTEERRPLTPGTFARFSKTGHLLVVTEAGTLLAATFDPKSFALGQPSPITEGLRVNPAGHVDLAVGDGRRLFYIAGSAVSDPVDQAVWVDRTGRASVVDSTWWFASSGNSGWSLSPDGNRLAIKLNTDGGQDIWVRDLRTGSLQRITFDPANDFRPRWSHDGQWVLFISERQGRANVYRQRADGTGTAQLLLDLPEAAFEVQMTPDGRALLARVGATTVTGTGRDVWVRQSTGDTAARPLLASPADERAMTVSPDGRWIAYQSDASGSNEVYIRPFPNVEGGQWQVSIGGGSAPLWSRNGRELFYVTPASEVVAVDLSNGPTQVGARTPLFSLEGFRVSTNYTWFDIHPDGRRFVMVRESVTDGRVIVVENFGEVLRSIK